MWFLSHVCFLAFYLERWIARTEFFLYVITEWLLLTYQDDDFYFDYSISLYDVKRTRNTSFSIQIAYYYCFSCDSVTSWDIRNNLKKRTKGTDLDIFKYTPLFTIVWGSYCQILVFRSEFPFKSFGKFKWAIIKV